MEIKIKINLNKHQKNKEKKQIKVVIFYNEINNHSNKCTHIKKKNRKNIPQKIFWCNPIDRTPQLWMTFKWWIQLFCNYCSNKKLFFFTSYFSPLFLLLFPKKNYRKQWKHHQKTKESFFGWPSPLQTTRKKKNLYLFFFSPYIILIYFYWKKKNLENDTYIRRLLENYKHL